MPIQGTSADITKLALGRIQRAIIHEGLDAFLVNTVHDEVVVEAAASQAQHVEKILVEQMGRAGSEFIKVVPVVVEATISSGWGG